MSFCWQGVVFDEVYLIINTLSSIHNSNSDIRLIFVRKMMNILNCPRLSSPLIQPLVAPLIFLIRFGP